MTFRDQRCHRRIAVAGGTSACVLVAAIAALSMTSAGAEVFKCKDSRGHITYSDSPCPGGSGGRVDLKEPVEDNGPRRPVVPPKADAADAPATAAAAPPPAAPPERGKSDYQLTYNDRQRITNLEQIERNPSAYAEQRRSATLEIANIRRGVLARMSFDDARKKDNYWADLASLDSDRRQTAQTQLASLFARYQ
jgi:hypothetical protein